MYHIIFVRPAKKEIAELPPAVKRRVLNDIRNLRCNPRPQRATKLRQRPGYRFSRGDFRIIYQIDNAKQIVYIYLVRARDSVYQKKARLG